MYANEQQNRKANAAITAAVACVAEAATGDRDAGTAATKMAGAVDFVGSAFRIATFLTGGIDEIGKTFKQVNKAVEDMPDSDCSD